MPHSPRSPQPVRRRFNTLPAFALYGEAGSPGAALLHIESIESRSRLYDWEIDAHVHQGLHQVLWLHSGWAEVVLDESRSRCEGPTAVLIPPGVAHAFRFSSDSDGHVLTVNAHLLAEGEAAGMGQALQQLFARPRTLPLEAGSPDVSRLQPLFEALQAENSADDAAEAPVPLWLARAVVWRLAQLGQRGQAEGSDAGQGGDTRRPSRRQALYTRWVVLLESHYREHWPVSRYAEQLGLSTERLNRMVAAETGRNAQELLHARLAREACRRLVHIAAPVQRIAFDLGFEDPAYFCRFFKRHTGQSPRAYRLQAQALGAEAPAGSG